MKKHNQQNCRIEYLEPCSPTFKQEHLCTRCPYKHSNMYLYNQLQKTSIKVNKSYEGESIEKKLSRILNNKEPITDQTEIIYTERKDGVRPEYNIRTDRFEIAIDAMDIAAKAHQAKREDNIQKFTEKLDKKNQKLKEKNSGAEPVQGTETPTD